VCGVVAVLLAAVVWFGPERRGVALDAAEPAPPAPG
jgi:hypothetical protein